MVGTLLIGLLAGAWAQDEEPWEREGLGWGALPAVNFNSDEGFGFGAVGSIYSYDGVTAPYKVAVDLVVFTTTRAVHTHSVALDVLELAGGSVRLTSKVEFAASRTGNYCGLGADVTCDPEVARAAVEASSPPADADLEQLTRQYYQVRSINPNGRVDLRWLLAELPAKVEAFGGWRGSVLIPGDFSDSAPYPGSLYARDFPGGEKGFTSVLQAGIALDGRDNEPAPTEGYWLEASGRAATPVWGSQFTYVGFNTTLRGYLPLGTPRLVLADRLVFDGLSGDAHFIELGRPGGLQNYTMYGGFNAGRGIRQRRYLGRVKLMDQVELRATPVIVPVSDSLDIAITVLGFVDAGFVVEDWAQLPELFDVPVLGTGGGLRLAFNQNFVVRGDVGVSAIEDWAPAVYLDLRNTF